MDLHGICSSKTPHCKHITGSATLCKGFKEHKEWIKKVSMYSVVTAMSKQCVYNSGMSVAQVVRRVVQYLKGWKFESCSQQVCCSVCDRAAGVTHVAHHHQCE